LWLHKLRSLLTALGMVFGVSSVIAMLAIGEGASYEAQEEIKKMGRENILLFSQKPTSDTQESSGGGSFVLEYGLTFKDVSRIHSTINGIQVVAPAREIQEYVYYQANRVDAQILATVPWYAEMRNREVLKGRFFTEVEMDSKWNVCALDNSVASDLFPLTNPIGKSVRVGENYYRVIGVLADFAGSSDSGEEDESSKVSGASNVGRMYIPISTAQIQFGETLIKRRSGSIEAEKVELHEVTVKVSDMNMAVGTAMAIRTLLERTHAKEDFKIVVPVELLETAQRTQRIFSIVLGSIAAISLIVGGIGIMNIMLATVTERTREIGVRRALGARQNDIVLQFLIETVILAGVGGLIGVALGVTIPFAVTYFADMKTLITPMTPVIAFSISALVGIAFGIYPALRAAKMDPVEALRHE
jgi:putative ABC transport system permease protein